VLAAVDAQADSVAQIIEFVHAHPELGHAEYACSAYLADRLSTAGVAVERGVGGMETAFRATLSGARPGRRVGLVALYDAVPSVREHGAIVPVHSCGHGPIAGGVLAAVLALATLRDDLAGDVVIIGCPADEIHAPGTVARGGGKAVSAAADLWDDIDIALYAHPEYVNTVSTASKWMRRDGLHVLGTRSLEPATPQRPLIALHDLMAAIRESDPSRVMLEHVSFDGDVEEGTGLVLDATVLYFADDEAGIARAADAVRDRTPAGAWSSGDLVVGIQSDAAVTAAVADAFAAAGLDFVPDPPSLPFATDFGNISRRVPSALIGVGRSGGWSYHTDEGAAQFASSAGTDIATGIARVLALSASRLSETR
jgi:metal-dependent amidase/aminoacylase/carboxypeptidase family protein